MARYDNIRVHFMDGSTVQTNTLAKAHACMMALVNNPQYPMIPKFAELIDKDDLCVGIMQIEITYQFNLDAKDVDDEQ